VLCVGAELVSGRVANPDDQTNPDPDGIGFVEVMGQLLGARYTFLNAGYPNCTLHDFKNPTDPVFPQYYYGGAYEGVVEPHLEAATGNPVDLAVIFFGFLDAAKLLPSGLGWFESSPTSWGFYISNVFSLIQRLTGDGVPRFLVLTPLRWDDPVGANVIVENRLEAYRIVLTTWYDDPISPQIQTACLDIYDLLDQATYYINDAPSAWWWPTQAGHDLLARTVASGVVGMGLT
jgi:hypothetical protein